MAASDLLEIKSIDNGILYFHIKGFWSDKIVEAVQDDLLKIWSDAVAKFGGERFIAMPDLTKFSVNQDIGKALIAQMMKHAMQNNMYHSIQIIPNPVARMAVADSVRAAGEGRFRTVAKSHEEALEIAAQKQEELNSLAQN